MSSGERPEFSPHIYNELNEHLRSKDRDRAIELIIHLLASGRPIAEIILETGLSSPGGEGDKEDGPERDLPQVSPASSATQAVNHQSAPPAASLASPNILERLAEHFAGSKAEGPIAAGGNLNGAVSGERNAEVSGSPIGPYPQMLTGVAQAQNTEALSTASANLEASPIRSEEPHSAEGKKRPADDVNSRRSLRLIALCIAIGATSAAAGGVMFWNRAPEILESFAAQYASPTATAPAESVSAETISGRAESSTEAAPTEAPAQRVTAEAHAPAVAIVSNELNRPFSVVAEPPIPERAPAEARRETALQSRADLPVPGRTERRVSETEIAALVLRGDALLTNGDIASARAFYELGADAGNATAALRLGSTFDPTFLGLAEFRGVLGDQAKALRWYNRARDLGNTQAEILIQALESSRK